MRATRPQHVWVDVTNQWGEHACPGVLIAWRQIVDHGHPLWQGWVIYAAQGAAAHGGNVSVQQSWIDGRLIRPAPGERPTPDLSRYRPLNAERPR